MSWILCIKGTRIEEKLCDISLQQNFMAIGYTI